MNFQDKSRLFFRGETFLERILSNLTDFKHRFIITNNNPSFFPPLDADFYPDLVPGIGPLGGIYTALNKAEENQIFITTCDMPLITKTSIETIAYAGDYDLIIPVHNGKFEMLFAVYSKKCLSQIEDMIINRQYKITGIFDDDSLLVKKVPVDDSFMKTLRNINTPEEYNKLTGNLPKS